jgi:hypothetical protein
MVRYESENEITEDESGDSRSDSEDHGQGGLHWVERARQIHGWRRRGTVSVMSPVM